MKSPEKPIVTQALLYWSGAGNRTRVYYGANAVQPAFGGSPPDWQGCAAGGFHIVQKSPPQVIEEQPGRGFVMP